MSVDVYSLSETKQVGFLRERTAIQRAEGDWEAAEQQEAHLANTVGPEAVDRADCSAGA
jgi:hypothetical protein